MTTCSTPIACHQRPLLTSRRRKSRFRSGARKPLSPASELSGLRFKIRTRKRGQGLRLRSAAANGCASEGAWKRTSGCLARPLEREGQLPGAGSPSAHAPNPICRKSGGRLLKAEPLRVRTRFGRAVEGRESCRVEHTIRTGIRRMDADGQTPDKIFAEVDRMLPGRGASTDSGLQVGKRERPDGGILAVSPTTLSRYRRPWQKALVRESRLQRDRHRRPSRRLFHSRRNPGRWFPNRPVFHPRHRGAGQLPPH